MTQVERNDWKVTYELGEAWREARKIKVKNSSLFKVDVLVYPQLALRNLLLTQIYQVLFDLSPAVEVSLWKGMKLTGQLKIPVYNDGYGSYEDKIHPGHLTISQRFRLPYNVFGKVTVGYLMPTGMAWMLNSFVPLQMKGFLSWRGWDVQLLAIGTAFGFIMIRKWD